MHFIKRIKKRLEYFAEYGTFHGLIYVVQPQRPLIVRVIWSIIFILSFYGMIKVFQASYKSYMENAVSFVTETAYLNWNTTFPAITICEISGTEISWDKEAKDFETVQEFILDLLFFTGSCYSCNSNCPTCEKLNFKEIVKKYRKKCWEILSQCRWKKQEFDCCEYFQSLETEYGVCYSLNSLHTLISKTNLNFYSNRKTGPGSLFIQTLQDVRVYFHAIEDVPFINSDPDQRKDVLLGESYNISINIIEIENDDNVKNLPVNKRECRFPDEKPSNLLVHKYYSYSTCIVQCHAKAHFDICNCTHHHMPVLSDQNYCDIKGLRCLHDNYETVNRLHARGFNKPGLVCDCVPSCTEPEYKVVTESKGIKSNYSEISIGMQALPTSRFKRIVVRTTMDLVVSIGSAAGLFIGASLLSIVEMIYLVFLRTK